MSPHSSERGKWLWGGASWSRAELYVTGRRDRLRGAGVVAFLRVVENVTQNTGNWDRKVPRGTSGEAAQSVTPLHVLVTAALRV